VKASEVVVVEPDRGAVRPVEPHAGVLDRAILVEELGGERTDVGRGVVEAAELVDG